ncbi:hypothetical protein ASU35_12465 [Acetivibrio ethanolgignens]|uniref:GGDEF domain-containing protein n=2 Tax=Acetivibrio ethanolgignens TaxID=290052 RepID=A0A0V8QDF4_9FIRM|nr:hypothetical protein ASU35_12465 [Acetivibrio ethanolgignens]
MKVRKIGLDWQSVMLVVYGVMFFGVFFWLFPYTGGSSKGFDNEAMNIMDNIFRVTVNEETVMSTLPAQVKAEAGEKIILETVLREQKKNDIFMAFYDRHTAIKVYLNDQLYEGTDEPVELPFKMTPGSYWHCVRLPEDYDGMRLRIERIPFLDSYSNALPTIYIGTKSAFLYMVIKQGIISLSIGFYFIIFGLLLMITGLFSQVASMRRRMFRLGLFILTLSIWILLDSRVTQLFTGNIYLAFYIVYGAFFAIPITGLAYLLTYPSIERNPLMRALFPISVLTYIVVHILQITNTFYFLEMFSVVHVEIALIIIGVQVCCLNYLRDKKRDKEEGMLYKVLGIIEFSAVVDILQYYLNPNRTVEKFLSRFGILFFMIALAGNMIKEVGRAKAKDEQIRLMNKMAYTDGMTGLLNRYAFDCEIDKIRTKEEDDEILILYMDMNNLKQINDQYGHARGDEAIRQVGYLLKAHFGNDNLCYRLGGDEFCVVSHWKEDNKVEQAIEGFLEGIEEFNREREYSFSVAYDYERAKGANVEECFKMADHKMYENKVKMKEVNSR